MTPEDLIEEIGLEFEYIETILRELEILYNKPPEFVPSMVEITATGGFLHNFYNGFENILPLFITPNV